MTLTSSSSARRCLRITATAYARPAFVSTRCRSPSTVSRPSRPIRLTVWLTVGPLWCSRSAMRARSGITPSSSSSRMVRRYISVVSTRSFTGCFLPIVDATRQVGHTGRVTESLTTVPALAEALASAEPPTVLDVRFRLGGPPTRADYEAGHIPGAVFVDLDKDLSGRPGPGGRHPLPDPAALQAVLRASGVGQDRPVVAYDGGESQAAARLWWTLRWAGHPAVRVLDGGFAAWRAGKRPVEPGTVTPPPGDFTVRPGQLPVLDAVDAAKVAANGALLDA